MEDDLLLKEYESQRNYLLLGIFLFPFWCFVTYYAAAFSTDDPSGPNWLIPTGFILLWIVPSALTVLFGIYAIILRKSGDFSKATLMMKIPLLYAKLIFLLSVLALVFSFLLSFVG